MGGCCSFGDSSLFNEPNYSSLLVPKPNNIDIHDIDDQISENEVPLFETVVSDENLSISDVDSVSSSQN